MESLTRPAHRRKLSNASGVFSFSSKNVYDDVFAVPPPATAAATAAATKFKAPVGVETYGEIFGSSRGSSIPVLDLSVLKDKRTGLEDHRSCPKLDYAKIFGGFGDEVTAVPYEELFVEKGKECSSDKAAMNGKESPLRGSDNHCLSKKDRGHSSEASDQSIDAVKQVNMSYHKSSQRTKDGPSGTRHVAKLHAIPGFTYFIDETARQQKAEGDRPVPSIKNDVQRAWSFNIHEKNNGKKTEIPVPPKIMPDTVRQQKTEGDRPVPSIKSEVQRTWSFNGNIHEENNGRKTDIPTLNTVCQQKTEGDRPVPSIKSEVQHTWSFNGNMQEENNGKKSEMPVPNILTSEGVNKGKRGSWWDGSRSNDKLFSSGEISRKSHSFKSSPSSSPPAKLNDIKGHPKRSRSMSFASKANASEKSGDYLTGSSDEELDMNSAAAASAAALRKAIEQAQESIRLAKELMERKKDGFQGHSKPNSKARERKESRTDRDANNIKENSTQETYERFDNVFQGFTGKSREPTLQTNEVAAPLAHSDTVSASRRVEVEKHQKNVVEIHGTKAWLSDLGNYGNDRSMTSATGQIQNKITTKDRQACDIDETEKSEETSACLNNNVEKTKVIEQDFLLGSAQSRTNVHPKAQESKVTGNTFNSAHMLHECGECEDILIGDIRNGFDELEESEEKFQECLDIIEEEKLVPSRLEDQNLVEDEKVPEETFQGRNMEREPEKDKDNDNELRNHSSEGGGMVNEEACLFVEEEDKPIAVVGDRSNEKAHEDTKEGEHSERSHPIEGKDVDEMVVIHAHKKEGTQRISEDKLNDEEAEELDLNEMEPTDAHDGNKSNNTLMEEYKGGEVQRGLEETYHYAGPNQNIPEEDLEREEVESRIEKVYLNGATESLWIEADKSTENQQAEVTQEAEEAEVVHLEADNCDNNQEIGSLQKAACERNSDTAFGTSREVQEPSRFDVSNENEKISKDAVENYEDNCGAPAVNEALYQCKRDADEEEESVKEASKLEEKETSETGHCVQRANQEHVIPSGMQSDSEAVASDDNGANVHCNEINHAQTLPKENTFEAVEFQNAVKENETNIKMQDASEAHLCDEKAAHTGSSENSRHRQIAENVEEESSFNPNIFDGLVHNSGESPENVNKEAEVAFDKEERDDVKVINKKRNMEEYSEEAKSIPLPSQSMKNQVPKETYKEMKTVQNMQHAEEYLSKTGAVVEKELRDTKQNGVKESNETRKIEANKREREWNTDRIAVERVIREARERAFAEARERAERAAVERASAEVRQRVMAEARGKLEKATTGSKADKASSEAKLKAKAERAAVERATAEARERALEKALSHKSTAEARVQAEKLSGVSRDNGLKHSVSSSDLENLDGTSSESAQRRKARLERHQRIMERAAKALEEKNTRDRLAQKEQAERNRLAETLDADVKRWASGKERNLRALLSTLQYILGPDSGWQPISLTEIITTVDVKKAYRKATLCVHPDKLQQRGASIHQKYICEKVFDLLKAAWNRFNSEER